jgi:hypothetical protein
VEVSLLLFALADPFHEVKRKRDKKKEVHFSSFGNFSMQWQTKGLNNKVVYLLDYTFFVCSVKDMCFCHNVRFVIMFW